MRIDDPPQMFGPLDRHPGGDLLERAAKDEAAFDEDDAEMLERRPRDAPARGPRLLGKGLSEVRARNAAAAAKEQIRDVAQPPAEAGGDAERQRGECRSEEPEGYACLRLRSRRTSTAIGTNDSTMTTITTM